MGRILLKKDNIHGEYRAELIKYHWEDITKLQTLINRDLRCWLR